MKLSKGMKFLIAAIVILGAYAGYDYYSSEKATQKKAEELKLVPFLRDQITDIRIENKGQVFAIHRDVDGWQITEPIKDAGDAESMDIFLSTLETESAKSVAREGEGIDWSTYGLAKPELHVSVKSSNGQSVVYHISSDKNYEQNTFLRKNDENKVYVVNATWQARAEKGVAELRDLRLLRHKIASIQELDLKTPAGHVLLTQKDGQWIDPAQPQKKVNQQRVYELLQSIGDTRAGKILLERELSSKEKFDYFLDKPVAELKLKLAEKNWSATFSRGAHELYALVSEPIFLMEIDPGNVDKFFKTKPDEFFAQEKK